MAERESVPSDWQSSVAILAVSPFEEDHTCLREIFSDPSWKVRGVRTYQEAVGSLCKDRMPIVLCESTIPGGTWKDILGCIAPLVNPPCLIVISRFADERLWSEVLNLGGYDVLAKPFDPDEVMRVVSLAWLHWKREQERSSSPWALRRAAGA